MDEILLDVDGAVRGGTLAALVERLCHDQLDESYSKVFLTTFKSFTTEGELFDLLVARFRIQPPPKLTSEGLAEWESSNKMRVLCILEAMIADEDVLDKEDMALLDRMLEFLKSDEVCYLNPTTALVKNIEHIKVVGDPLEQSLVDPPSSIIPRTAKRLLDIDPLELARQLTIKESELYRRIKPLEFLLRVRGRGPENIAIFIQTGDRSTRSAPTNQYPQVSNPSGLSVPNVEQFLYDGCDRIWIEYTTNPSSQSTWERVTARNMAQFAACEATVDSCNGQFGEYRRMIQTVNSPCIPFIGVFLSDLQSIHDKNPDTLSDGLINFCKRRMLSEVIGNIKQWQTQPFNLARVPKIMNYIDGSLGRLDDTKALRDRFWEMSIKWEPRERENKRVLQECHGFM